MIRNATLPTFVFLLSMLLSPFLAKAQINEDTMHQAFLADYEVFRSNFVIDAGQGALRVIHSPEVRDTSFEMQSLGEIFAFYAGDEQTFDSLIAYDRRYLDERGLAPWHINADGTVADETIVSNVMMTMAWIRLQSDNQEYREEGLRILGGIERYLINPDTNIPTAFHWPDSRNLTNPAYLNLFFMEEFAQYNPYWEEVAQASGELMESIGQKIDNGEIASFPNWVDMDGNPVSEADTGVTLGINYDIVYVTLQQAQEALMGENQDLIDNATAQLVRLNDFFYSKIAIQGGESITYDLDNLLDGYNLDGSVNTDETRWARTAWASAAAVASLVSEDDEYISYMIAALPSLPVDYPFNQYVRTYTNLVLSHAMDSN